MFRIVVLACVVFAGANRIKVHEVDSADKTKFGASCEDLQTTFRNRVAAFQASYDAIDNFEAISRYTQARLMMRTYGIIRTMRRARNCAWVADDNSEDMEQARGVVQSLLAGNPCAEAARSELEAGSSAETDGDQFRSLQRAMWVLTSDDCEATMPVEEITDLDPDFDPASCEATAMDAVREGEEQVRDAIDEMDDEEGEGAFIQTDQDALARFFRGLGVVFLMLFFAMACVGAVAFLGMAIGLMIGMTEVAFVASEGWSLLLYPLLGAYAGAGLGLIGCVFQTFNWVLPALTQGASSPHPVGK